MARRHATRLEVGAHRFLVRRMIHALVRRDVDMYDDPLRVQSLSLLAGCVIATIAVAACGVLAVLRPQGIPGSAAILIARETGALYVRIGDTLHPVLNLASARLIARSATNPVPAGEAAIAQAKRGPSVGIAGAPATVDTPLDRPSWMVCDDDRTVVIIGARTAEGFDAARAVLVTPRGESAAITYLLYEGRRAAVDLRNSAVVGALRLDGVVPVSVSRTLLDVVPEAPAIAPPVVVGAGAPGPATLGVAVGSVVRVRRAEAAQYYVVLADGVQPVSEVAADLVRFTYERRAAEITTVSPAAIAATPVVGALAVGTLPARAGVPVGAARGVAVCARWEPNPSELSNTVVMSRFSPLDADWTGLALAQADGAGPNVDAVAMPAGRSAYVRSARLVEDDGASGPCFLVTDVGVAYGVADDDAAKHLGLPDAPAPAPWPVLAQLPRGPELDVAAASVLHDGLATPS